MLTWADILTHARDGNPAPDRRVERPDEEWRERLTTEQYRITRGKGTERPFSSEVCSLFEPGLYACVCCDELLFDASEKFESGTGWPSFTQPIRPSAVGSHADDSLGMRRVESTCNTCDAHLGHVFPDGPPPSGLRYCINALALKKVDLEGDRRAQPGGEREASQP
jgi:peptide-methionine (R)-S-oxide reductase